MVVMDDHPRLGTGLQHAGDQVGQALGPRAASTRSGRRLETAVKASSADEKRRQVTWWTSSGEQRLQRLVEQRLRIGKQHRAMTILSSERALASTGRLLWLIRPSCPGTAAVSRSATVNASCASLKGFGGQRSRPGSLIQSVRIRESRSCSRTISSHFFRWAGCPLRSTLTAHK